MALFGIIGAGLTIAAKNFAGTLVDSNLRGLIKTVETEPVQATNSVGVEGALAK
jgi:hypothetical protein